jgi:hypothetical protein
MAVSASQLSEYLKSVFPSDPVQMNVQPVLVPTGRMRFAGDEIVGQGESGPEYRPRFEEETTLAGYYSPALGRQLTADETQHLIPLKEYVEGHGAVTSALLFPGTKAIAAFNEMGITGSQLSGQPTPGGFTIYPLAGTVATDQGDRTNIAIRYGESGAPEASAYQSSTLFGSAKVDKIVDQLAKAANAALLTSVGGLTLGPLGAGVLSNPAVAGAVAGAGQAAIKGGDTKDLLTGALSGYLQAPGAAEITAASDLAKIEASMGVPAGVGVTPGLLASISPEVAASNLGALESSLGTPSLPVTQFPTGVSPSDLAAIEASMGPTAGMQLPTVPNFQLAPKLEDIFAGFGDYNEAAQNLLGQAQGNLPTITGPTLPTLVNEPVRVPGDTRLVDTIAQPPLSVEDISGQLSPEAKRLMGMMDIAQPGPLLDLPAVGPEQLMPRDVLPDRPTFTTQQPPDLVGYNEAVGQALADAQKGFLESGKTLQDFLTPDTFVGPTMGDPTKAALYSNEGYGPISDQTVTGAPITASPITSLGPAANLNDVIDYLKGGAFVGSLGDALKEAFKAATGSGQQQGGGLGGLGPIIGGLLSRSPTAAPSATVTPGRPVDITSPIQSLLAPKLVQQRPVTLL